jgi:hypothetical protein
MLNRIVIKNSELYAKASIQIGDNASIQITAENNVDKKCFLNSLNFLYITFFHLKVHLLPYGMGSNLPTRKE